MKSRREIGSRGEQIAITFLERLGFQMLDTNYRSGRGEIDIICIKEGLLLFVEVKSRTHSITYKDRMKVRWKQQEKIRNTAVRYLSDCCWFGLVRFDVIEVFLDGTNAIRHYPGYLNQL